MSARTLRRAMIGVTVLGVALAAYLTYVHYSGVPPACTAGSSCLKVQTSLWSRLDGVPVALIGLIGYILILGSLLVPDREESRLATLGLTLIGFGFSVYLTYREIHSIRHICEECATSAVFLTVLCVASVVRYLMAPEPPKAKAAPRPAAGKSSAPEPAAKTAASATLGADGQ